MKKIYNIINDDNKIVWKVIAESQQEAAKKVAEKFGDYSIYLRIA